MAMAGAGRVTTLCSLSILLSLLRLSEAVRCYTDLAKTKVGHFTVSAASLVNIGHARLFLSIGLFKVH